MMGKKKSVINKMRGGGKVKMAKKGMQMKKGNKKSVVKKRG